MSIQNNLLAQLPEEISHNILSRLDRYSLACFGLASQKANRLANDDRLWKGLFPDFTTPNTEVKAFLSPYLKQAVASNDELFQRVRKFASKIQLGQTGRFICKFPSNPDQKIELECYPESERLIDDIKADVEEVWFFIKTLPIENTPFSHLFTGRNFVFVQASLVRNEIDLYALGEIVKDRLQSLENLPLSTGKDEVSEIMVAVGVVAATSLSLGLYLGQRI